MWKNIGDVVDCLQLFVIKSRKGSDRRRIGECGGEDTGGGNSLVDGKSLWHWALVGKKMDCIGNYYGTVSGDVYAVETIVFVGISDVPAVNCMRGLSATLGRGFED